MVGARGFEPPTPWSRTRCATRLRYAPNVCCGEMSMRVLSLRLKRAGGLLDRFTDKDSLADYRRWVLGVVVSPGVPSRDQNAGNASHCSQRRLSNCGASS